MITSRHVLTMKATNVYFMSEYIFLKMFVSDSKLYVVVVGERKRHTFLL
jgi:hypothetical protein